MLTSFARCPSLGQTALPGRDLCEMKSRRRFASLALGPGYAFHCRGVYPRAGSKAPDPGAALQAGDSAEVVALGPGSPSTPLRCVTGVRESAVEGSGGSLHGFPGACKRKRNADPGPSAEPLPRSGADIHSRRPRAHVGQAKCDSTGARKTLGGSGSNHRGEGVRANPSTELSRAHAAQAEMRPGTQRKPVREAAQITESAGGPRSAPAAPDPQGTLIVAASFDMMRPTRNMIGADAHHDRAFAASSSASSRGRRRAGAGAARLARSGESRFCGDTALAFHLT